MLRDVQEHVCQYPVSVCTAPVFGYTTHCQFYIDEAFALVISMGDDHNKISI